MLINQRLPNVNLKKKKNIKSLSSSNRSVLTSPKLDINICLVHVEINQVAPFV